MSNQPRRARRGLLARSVLASLLAAWAVAPAAGAQEPEPQRTAVLSPLIDALRFGDTVGLSLACSTGLSLAGNAAGSDPALAAAVSPVLGELSTGCATFSAQGAAYLDAAQDGVTPLQGINPVANPLIQALASTLGATADADTDVPFGDSLEETVAIIEWFGT